MTIAGVRSLFAAFLLAAAGAASAAGPVTAPISAAGRWMVDDQGRVVVFHGFNIMWKAQPWYPKFVAQDAAFLADNGFNVARLGLIWKGLEPEPGAYDFASLREQGELDALLGTYGIRTIVDTHQDFWNRSGGGPDWASPGGQAFPVNFQNFWDDGAAADGVGVQTRFNALWTPIAAYFEPSQNVLGYDTFNEPQPGIASGCSPMLEPCPTFESGTLTDFYRRNFAAVRAADTRHLLFPEGVTQSGAVQPSLPKFDDARVVHNAHIYCPTFIADQDQEQGCGEFERNGLANYVAYSRAMDIPLVITEFSSTDSETMNLRMVDIMAGDFVSWTAWAYNNDSGGGIGAQGFVIDDSQPGSEANAKPAKLNAFVVPYAQAIAGTPLTQSFDRATKTYRLSYEATAVPGATLAQGARTQVFIPQRQYPHGYLAAAKHARVVSAPGAPWIELAAENTGDVVELTVTPATDSVTQRPADTAQFPQPAASRGGAGLFWAPWLLLAALLRRQP